MKTIDFNKEWEKMLFETHENKSHSNFTENIIKARELLLYAQVDLAKSEEAFRNKNKKRTDFHFDLYSVAMKHYFKMLSNEQIKN